MSAPVCRLLVVVAVFSLLSACASSTMPSWQEIPSRSGASAREIVERSVEVHGGNVFEEISDLNVSYSGKWGFWAPKIQRVLVDKRYRKASEERYLLREETIFQQHRGPGGTKTVLRSRDAVRVFYDGREEKRESRLSSSALVADVYLMLISGPSFFLREQVDLEALPQQQIEGRHYDVVLARIRPGFGFSPEDRAQLWIDRESGLLHRVQFSIEGYEKTRGAEVDVTFSDHREIGGWLWPTRFVERIREPFDVFAHRWRLEGLDIDRGLATGDLEHPRVSTRVAWPAALIDEAPSSR